MASVQEIVRDVQNELEDQTFSVVRMIELMNDAQMLIAFGSFPQYPEVFEICLPELETDDYITTSASASSVDLSGLTTYTFQKKLLSAYSQAQNCFIRVAPSWAQIQTFTGDTDPTGTGTLEYVALAGTKLWYARRAAETLRLTFFRQPTALDLDSTSTAIPEPFDRFLLRSFILAHIPKRYRGELGYNPMDEWRSYLGQLSRHLGVYAEPPIPINNTYLGHYSR